MTETVIRIPTLTTDRLTLRAPLPSDFAAYADFRASDRSRTVGGPFPRDVAFSHFCELAGHWQVRGFGRWIVADRATDEPLGVVGLYYPLEWPEPEIGWSVFAAGEGRGVAYEAALATRAYAYGTLGWTTLVSLVSPANTRSLALARRMAATHEYDFQHPTYGTLGVWRHLGPEALQ